MKHPFRPRIKRTSPFVPTHDTFRDVMLAIRHTLAMALNICGSLEAGKKDLWVFVLFICERNDFFFTWFSAIGILQGVI